MSDPAGLADGLELDRKAELASKLGFDCVAVDHEFPSSTSVKDYMWVMLPPFLIYSDHIYNSSKLQQLFFFAKLRSDIIPVVATSN